jgi:hypothetical protein
LWDDDIFEITNILIYPHELKVEIAGSVSVMSAEAGSHIKTFCVEMASAELDVIFVFDDVYFAPH